MPEALTSLGREKRDSEDLQLEFTDEKRAEVSRELVESLRKKLQR